MQLEKIRYVKVWSGWLRLTHWLIAMAVLFQIASAWALVYDSVNRSFWLDWHLIIGQVILMLLTLRFVLLFVPGSSHWRAFIPERAQLQAMVQMIKFYLSLARFPLPNWYAHNPLWLPVYPLLFLVLTVSAISGLLFNSSHTVFGLPMYDLHLVLSGVIIVFTIFHIISVFLHDLKGKGAYISAMINGFRYFHSAGVIGSKSLATKNEPPETKIATVSVSSIKRQGNKD